jgi:segregation and condensation protein B
MAIDEKQLKNILEAALLVNDKPQSVAQLQTLFEGDAYEPDKKQIGQALASLADDFLDRGIELKEVATGYRIQARQEYEPWISRSFQERAPRYSRALLETLALVAYRQPTTRSEIEQVRGVSVSSHIIKTLLEREWIRVVGHREVPGRPAMYGTTREFLDYFNLSSLEQLPTLAEVRDLDTISKELAAAVGGQPDVTEAEDTAEQAAEGEELHVNGIDGSESVTHATIEDAEAVIAVTASSRNDEATADERVDDNETPALADVALSEIDFSEDEAGAPVSESIH